ncbi:hypothetical protein J437_LFUL005389 [Ladona fulva]|uniref:CD80-like immunoglobulin C2-set domain-containing protein n=1 Tax=Ladona fulva TaxID=123851 RepID=A0A8K0K0D7_LADFU|nr:hypothetical protein J437_LFUL005389 [Ladona fulva]
MPLRFGGRLSLFGEMVQRAQGVFPLHSKRGSFHQNLPHARNARGPAIERSRIFFEPKRSNASHVYLRHMTPAISGKYSCEVSADAPSFHTALVSGDMDVVDVPRSRPSITGVKPRYRVGEMFSGNCSSSPSSPPANLTWVINGKVANPFFVTQFPHTLTEVTESEETRRMGSHVGLQFVVGHQHFLRNPGKLKIRCTASIHGLYWQSTEISVEEEKPKGPQVMEGTRPSYHETHFDGVVVEEKIFVLHPDTEDFQDLNSGSHLQIPWTTIAFSWTVIFVSFR